ncbi:hypothetical protein ABGB12_29485 [Actinocorallia sp. B10E7]|uniref:hypothetical protein n=1 Tax=Actinocorallia sp. B10E7 TaxID=3153558 RepID=UPI00325F0295
MSSDRSAVVMAGVSGFHQEDEAARRAREQELQRLRQERQALEKERLALEKERRAWEGMRLAWEKEHQARERESRKERTDAQALDEEAARRTSAARGRVVILQRLLKESLERDPRIAPASLKRQAKIPPLELGDLEEPHPVPSRDAYVPSPPGPFGRMFEWQQHRYEAEVEEGEAVYRRAVAEHERQEANRLRRIAEAKRTHEQEAARITREVAEENARIEQMIVGLRNGDHDALGGYLTMVLQKSSYPQGFPTRVSAVQLPESALLVVEKRLPTIEVIPPDKAFRHVRSRKAVESTPRPMSEIRDLYQSVIAQIVLRTLREVFTADTAGRVTTVVFNGLVRAVDPATGRRAEVCLIALRATREQFADLVLDEPEFDPLECVRRHFSAKLSPRPEALVAVEPIPV